MFRDLRCLCGDPECPWCFPQDPQESSYDPTDDRYLAQKESEVLNESD